MTIVGRPFSSHLRRSFRFPMSYKRSVLPRPTRIFPWNSARAIGTSPISGVLCSICNLRPPSSRRYTRKYDPVTVRGCNVSPCAVPTTTNTSPPRSWNTQVAILIAASLSSISATSRVSSEMGSIMRRHEAHLPLWGGLGAPVCISVTTSSSSSSSSSSPPAAADTSMSVAFVSPPPSSAAAAAAYICSSSAFSDALNALWSDSIQRTCFVSGCTTMRRGV